MADIRAKWRPSVALVVGVVCLALVSVPVLAFLGLRLTSNHFVRDTEQTLTHQAAIFAQVYAKLLTDQGEPPRGRPVSGDAVGFWAGSYHPSQPVLNLRRSPVLPPLPDIDEIGPADLPAPAAPYQNVTEEMLALARAAAKTTLAGAIFLDERGIDIRDDRRADYADAPEVAAALKGKIGSALRDRGGTFERHPLTSISRDTWYRVHLAYPVIVENRVAGVVYLSRTPSNFAKFVLAERTALIMMGVAMLFTALLVGLLLHRLFSAPIRALSAQTTEIAQGRLSEPEPLQHYGVRESAALGQSVIRMAKTLSDRSRQTSVYTDHVTHELKSPVTAILGAAELLGTEGLAPEARTRLHQNIEDEAIRMNALLERLREMTRLRDAPTTGSGDLADMLPDMPELAVEVTPNSETRLPMLPEHGAVLFHHLARNAVEHGATELKVSYREGRLSVADNGRGIPAEHRAAVTDPFFTTRREEGGTGLGLAIVTALLQNYDAEISVAPSDSGALIVVEFASPA